MLRKTHHISIVNMLLVMVKACVYITLLLCYCALYAMKDHVKNCMEYPSASNEICASINAPWTLTDEKCVEMGENMTK